MALQSERNFHEAGCAGSSLPPMKAYRGLVRDKTRRSSIETIATTPLFIGSRKKLRRIWLLPKRGDRGDTGY